MIEVTNLELGLLRSVLSDPIKALPAVVDLLDESDFVADEYGKIYGAAKELFLTGKPVDELTIATAIGNGCSVSDLTAITLEGGFEPPSKAGYYSQLIREARVKAVINQESRVLSSMEGSLDVREGLARLDAISNFAHSKLGAAEVADSKSGIAEVRARIERFENTTPVYTGWKALDANVVAGLEPGHLWTLVGYTSAGKTLALVDICAYVLNKNPDKGVLFYSLEMTREEIFRRFIANISGAGSNQVLMQTAANPDAVEQAMTMVEGWPLWVYESTFDLPTMFSTVRRLQQTHPVSVLVIDYAQLVSGNGKLYEIMRDSAFQLKEQAKRLGITIIAASQVDNASVRDPSAKLIPAKGGGDLPASSEVVLVMHKEGRDVTVEIKKNKHGPTGTFRLRYKDTWSGLESIDTEIWVGQEDGSATQ